MDEKFHPKPKTRHVYLAMTKKILDYISTKTPWRKNIYKLVSLSFILKLLLKLINKIGPSTSNGLQLATVQNSQEQAALWNLARNVFLLIHVPSLVTKLLLLVSDPEGILLETNILVISQKILYTNVLCKCF
jgi:hypothetical protein